MVNPFFTPNGHSIDISLGNEAVSNIVESAYLTIEAEVGLFDKRIRKDHDDFLVFDSYKKLEKAAAILEDYDIQFKTNMVEKTTIDQVDFQSEANRYKVVVPNQPDVDGAYNVDHPRIYKEE